MGLSIQIYIHQKYKKIKKIHNRHKNSQQSIQHNHSLTQALMAKVRNACTKHMLTAASRVTIVQDFDSESVTLCRFGSNILFNL